MQLCMYVSLNVWANSIYNHTSLTRIIIFFNALKSRCVVHGKIDDCINDNIIWVQDDLSSAFQWIKWLSNVLVQRHPVYVYHGRERCSNPIDGDLNFVYILGGFIIDEKSSVSLKRKLRSPLIVRVSWMWFYNNIWSILS